MSISEEGEDVLAARIARAKEQDPRAEEELYAGFRGFVKRRLQGTALRRNWFWLRDIDEAVQEVFVHFFRALRAGKFTFMGRQHTEGFLVRTAFFVAMNQKDKAPERTVSLHDPEEGGLRFDMADFAEALYDQVDRQACLRLLAAALAELNLNRREVLERTLLGQKVRQICAETGRSPASVSGLKFNALRDLRHKLVEAGFLSQCGELFGLGAGEAS